MNYIDKYLKYKLKYLELIGGKKNKQVSNPTKKIKTNIDNIYISQVQYNSCGMTCVISDKPIDYYIDKRGKNVYGLGTDMLYGNAETAHTYAQAICLVGSSTLGLEGICGVNQALIEDNGNEYNVPAIGATCYTLNIIKKDFTHPDIQLGKFAFEKRNKDLMIGKVGAGVNTRIGKLYDDYLTNSFYAGQGASYLEKDRMKCFCIVVLNSLGVVHENGTLLHPFKIGNEKIKEINELPKADLFDSSINARDHPKNTTLTIFVTNIKYNEDQMKTLSKELHDVVESMVYPYGTLLDGDIFFLASSKEIESHEDYLDDYKNVIKEAIRSPFK
jgi:L-aminopeptidase/D-esterase-like protein